MSTIMLIAVHQERTGIPLELEKEAAKSHE